MRFFLSYPRKDKDKSDNLLKVLRSGGYEIWKDTEELRVGQDWQQELRDAIEQSDGIVLALTPNWLASPYCQWEFVTAVENNKKVIPVLLTTTSLPDRISKIQFFDFTDGFDDQAKNNRFLDEVQSLAQSVSKTIIADIQKSELETTISHKNNDLKTGDVASGSIVTGTIEASSTFNHSPITVERTSGPVNIGGIQIFQTVARNPLYLTLLIFLILLIVLLIGWSFIPIQDQINIQNFFRLVEDTPTPSPSPTATPVPEAGAVVIAFAHFYNGDNSGVSPEDGRNLVAQMEQLIISELDGGTMLGNIPIALVSSRDIGCIGQPIGDDPDENPFTCDGANDDAARLLAAQFIANTYGAGIVLYGKIIPNGDSFSVVPEFYIDRSTFSEALELTGQYRLGEVIEPDELTTQLNSNIQTLEINQVLQNRMVFIAQIFAGLVYYSQGDYRTALGTFNQANSIDATPFAGGLEVLHILLGNTKLRIASETMQRDTSTSDVVSNLLAESIQEYQLAEDLAGSSVEGRSQYSRSYTGLASATYLRWVLMAQEQSNDIFSIDYDGQLALLDEALGYLDNASRAIDQPDDTGIENRTRFTRIQILYALYALNLDVDVLDNLDIDDAECNFRAIEFGNHFLSINSPLVTDLVCNSEALLRDLGQGAEAESSLKGIGSETYFYLARVALIDNPDLCPNLITMAIDLNPPSIRAMFMNALLGDCHIARNDYENAILAYNEAINLALEVDAHPDDIERFTQARNEARDYDNGRG